ncbi:protein of unknown function [Burkholderia multivorans]
MLTLLPVLSRLLVHPINRRRKTFALRAFYLSNRLYDKVLSVPGREDVVVRSLHERAGPVHALVGTLKAAVK